MSPADSHLKVIAFQGTDSCLSRPLIGNTQSRCSRPNRKSPGQENIGEPMKSPTMEIGGYTSGYAANTEYGTWIEVNISFTS